MPEPIPEPVSADEFVSKFEVPAPREPVSTTPELTRIEPPPFEFGGSPSDSSDYYFEYGVYFVIAIVLAVFFVCIVLVCRNDRRAWLRNREKTIIQLTETEVRSDV